MAKKEENTDLLENPEVIAEKLEGAEHWIEEHLKIVLGVLGAIVLIVGGYFGYKYYIGGQDEQAQKEMFQAVRYFEADSLNLALKEIVSVNNSVGVPLLSQKALTVLSEILVNRVSGYNGVEASRPTI